MRKVFLEGALACFAALLPVAGAAAAGDPPPVEIDEYVVDGNTTLPQIEIEKAVYPYLGPGRKPDDIEAARTALETDYHDHGFQTVAVTVAAPEPVDGVIHLQVAEQAVGRLRVVGAEYHSPADIKAQATSLAEGTVPNFNDVQRDVAALNTWPDRTVTPVLKAGKDPGTIDVDLKVEDQVPVSGSVELNNRQSQGTTPLRLNASVDYDNLWQLGHSLAMNFQIAPENPADAKVFVGTYTIRFPDNPYSIQLTGMESDSNVNTAVGAGVVGNGHTVGARFYLPLPGTEHYVQTLFAEIAYKHFLDQTDFGSTSTKTPVTYFPATVGYSGTLTEAKATDQGNLSLTFSSPEIGSPVGEFDNKRYLARGQNFYLKADVSRLDQLPFGIDTWIRLAAQVTDQPLISNEQMNAGGLDTVRGYLEAEELGDLGYVGTMELRSPPLIPLLDLPDDVTATIDDWHALLFFDAAQLFLRNPLPEQKSTFGMKSFGVGTQLKVLHRFNAALDLAVPMLSTQFTEAYSRKLLFRFWTEF